MTFTFMGLSDTTLYYKDALKLGPSQMMENRLPDALCQEPMSWIWVSTALHAEYNSLLPNIKSDA
ncbi:hypothetical protein EYF80_021990 [Liparis tanakae]|uniref:Uncharacterized protein n=1 Tax=Liparis tanakae TaxID=230148 RepID=A0A4Z2HPR3_9TELE|nr:hypothetical protein EYF80_021990 [Liparis tanakae]